MSKIAHFDNLRCLGLLCPAELSALHCPLAKPSYSRSLGFTPSPGERRRAVEDKFERYQACVAQRLRDGQHVWASALYDEVKALGYEQSCVTNHAMRPNS